jgi:hypothetical protein
VVSGQLSVDGLSATIAGGQNNQGDDLDTAEVFDADSNIFTTLSSRMSTSRAFFAAAALTK